MRAMRMGFALVVGMLGACQAQQLGGGQRDAGSKAPMGTRTGDGSTMSVYSGACWAASLPAETQPIFPASSVVEACAAATGTPAWSYPAAAAGGDVDDRRYLVGRWATCNAGLAILPPHSAIEFGANGRWRLLALD